MWLITVSLCFFVLNTWCYLNEDIIQSRFIENLNDLLADKSKYDKGILPPTTSENDSIQIKISMIICGFQEISDVKMKFSVDMYLIETWIDRRLLFIYNETIAENYFLMQPEMLELIWKPDTTFTNAIQSIDSNSRKATHKHVLKINGNGNVYNSARLTVTATCKMNLRKFPFDIQYCTLLLRSNVDGEKLKYKWDNNEPVSFITDLIPPNWIFSNYSTHEFKFFTNREGMFNGLSICFVVKRKINFYIMDLYVPASLIVFVAWLTSFAQYTFTNLLTVLLAQLCIYLSYIAFMPKVNGIKLMDIFFAVCFLFILFAMVKTFFVQDTNFVKQKSLKQKQLSRNHVHNLQEEPNSVNHFPKSKVVLFMKLSRYCDCIEWSYLLSIIYPACFVLFCIIYFVISVYVISSNMQTEECNK